MKEKKIAEDPCPFYRFAYAACADIHYTLYKNYIKGGRIGENDFEDEKSWTTLFEYPSSNKFRLSEIHYTKYRFCLHQYADGDDNWYRRRLKKRTHLLPKWAPQALHFLLYEIGSYSEMERFAKCSLYNFESYSPYETARFEKLDKLARVALRNYSEDELYFIHRMVDGTLTYRTGFRSLKLEPFTFRFSWAKKVNFDKMFNWPIEKHPVDGRYYYDIGEFKPKQRRVYATWDYPSSEWLLDKK